MAIPITKKNVCTGFTLIELLVVIVIISIVASIAMVTISANQHKRFATDANQLRNLILLAEEEALLRPGSFGISVRAHQIQFFAYYEEERRWQPMTETLLGVHTYDNDTELSLKMHDTLIPQSNEPAIIISANGDLTAFTLLIGKTHNKPCYQLIGNENGALQIEAAS